MLLGLCGKEERERSALKAWYFNKRKPLIDVKIGKINHERLNYIAFRFVWKEKKAKWYVLKAWFLEVVD